YTKLFVFKYEGAKGLHKLFENGSTRGVEVSSEGGIPMIKVGRPMGPDDSWTFPIPEPRWEVYQWDGREFRYQALASTAAQTPEPREYQGLVGTYKTVDSQAVSSGSVPRVKKGDKLVYRRETVVVDDAGKEQIYSQEVGDTFRVSRESHQEFKVVKKEDFGEAYGFYLKPGLSWEDGRKGLTQSCSRETGKPCYYVEKVEDIAVPAGIFRNCFKIVMDNASDFDARWYYPGIGIVRSEHRGQAPLLRVSSVLEEIIRQ
ncbi:MAG: hypothetical protein HQL21_06555, partial [Candidatus Omnitrophica bacterium]|nr:hypothetical protein [Candidatus Omnitrophota bacterium]